MAMVNGQESPRFLMEAKLAESGLGPKDAKLLHVSCLTHGQVTKLDPAFKSYPALQLPYFDLKGRRTKFYRLRYRGEMRGFDKRRKKQGRYVQPTDSTSEAYLPLYFDW